MFKLNDIVKLKSSSIYSHYNDLGPFKIIKIDNNSDCKYTVECSQYTFYFNDEDLEIYYV